MKYTLEELHEIILPMVQSLGNRTPEELTGAIVEVFKQDREAQAVVDGDTSDGYHTFKELYRYRLLYNAALFKEWSKTDKWCLEHDLLQERQHYFGAHKSKLHSDGEVPFGGGWFIVIAQLPTGQISNHYELADWDLFDIPEREKAAEYDGHTPEDVAVRLTEYLKEGSHGTATR